MNESSRPVAIVGGSGFIGGAIRAALAAQGGRTVSLDLEAPRDALPGATFRYYDLTRAETWPADWSAFSAVILAAGILEKGCVEAPRRAWTVNVCGSIALIDAVTSASDVPRMIFLSSGRVYDADRGTSPLVETDPVKAQCLYSASKISLEMAVRAAAEGNLLKALVLRPFTVFGPGQMRGDRGHLFGRWLELCRRGHTLPVHGDGSQVIDPVHVAKVVSASLAYLAAPRPPAFTIANVSGGAGVSIRRLAELFVEEGVASGFEFVPSPSQCARHGWGDSTAFEMLVGHPIRRDPEADVRAFLSSVRQSHSSAAL